MSKAIFMGSFDPPHQGHRDAILSIVHSDIMNRCNIDALHIIVAKQNPNKPKSTPFIDRYNMCLSMFSDIDNVIVDDIENNIEMKYTYDFFKYLRNNNGNIWKDFLWIITTETLLEIINGEWYRSVNLLCDNKFIVLVKDDKEIDFIKREINWDDNQIHFIKLNSNNNIHSSIIRNQYKLGNVDILDNTNNEVKKYIINNKLYIK